MKMHKLAWIALAGLVAACESPLDTNPTAAVDASTALTSARGVELALNGAYRTLQASALWSRQWLAYPDMYADNLNYTGTFTGDREVSIRSILPSNGEVGSMWSSSYQGITRVNYILDAMPEVSDLTEAKRNQYKGEALFIRSLLYYALNTMYGGVPLIEHKYDVLDESINVSRATTQETWNFIVKYLEEASTLLGTARNNGRATKGAADALLARVYLEMGVNDKARDKATALINNTTYKLLTNYGDLWGGVNKHTTESIYEIHYTTTNSNATAFWFYPTALGGRLGFAPSAGLIAAYETGDTRKAASIATASSGQVYGYKYRQVGTGTDNIPVLRLAEMYLIRAEANARLNAAAAIVQADINTIRNRAGLANTTAATQQELLDAVLQERRVELAMEGHRFWDLRRHGKAATVLGIAPTKLVWPVPQYERDVNPNLAQNPGY